MARVDPLVVRANSDDPATAAAPTAVVCDDDPMMRQLAARLLDREGYGVVAEVDSAYAAIQVAKLARPTVLLLDLVLPDFSGEVALPQIRSASPATQIVIWSGYDSTYDFAAAGATVVPKATTSLGKHLCAIRATWAASRSTLSDARRAHEAHEARKRLGYAPLRGHRIA